MNPKVESYRLSEFIKLDHPVEHLKLKQTYFGSYLTTSGDSEAKEALEYLIECEAAGDFEEFSPDAWASFYE